MTWLDALGWLGSAVLVLSLLQARILRMRIINLAGSFILLVFNALISVWPMVAMNSVLVGINLVMITRLLRERHDSAAFEVLDVGWDNPYLQRILRVQHDDILKFQPDFTGPGSGDHAFVVMRGTEIVGVVILDRDGDIARIRLDYVTPAYRDFTPGEFVWRQSDLLGSLGFRHVMSPPGMKDAYYGGVGFKPNGREWVLDL